MRAGTRSLFLQNLADVLDDLVAGHDVLTPTGSLVKVSVPFDHYNVIRCGKHGGGPIGAFHSSSLIAPTKPHRGKLRPPFQFEETFLAKPNYSFEKRQREIARKKKQDEKRQRKVQRAPDEPAPVDQQTQPIPPETDTAV